MKRFVGIIPVLLLFLFACVVTLQAKQFELAGNPLNILGYISQGMQYSLANDANDKYDVEKDLNQALSTFLIEADYKPANDLKFYASGKLTYDWIYDIKSEDSSWHNKRFSNSRETMAFDDEWWQIWQEGHVTWNPGVFMFRFGKQIVSWGEMDFLQVMDQINPVDSRRGFADVEFEETVIPINMVRAEWWPTISEGGYFIDQIGIQLVAIPNGNFIPNQGASPGNDKGGVWAANVVGGGIRTGAFNEIIEEPDSYEFEVGARIQALKGYSIFTLNAFYGRANAPVTQLDLSRITDIPGIGPFPAQPITQVDTNGIPIVNLNVKGYYPRQKFVGVTLATEIPQLGFSALGGHSPVIRSEVKYEIDKQFSEHDLTPLFTGDGYIESDWLQAAVGIDWKFKFNWLNSKAYINTSLQVFYDKIFDYPDSPLTIADKPNSENLAFSMYVDTSYLNAKIIPHIAYLNDTSNEGNLLLVGVSYSPSTRWSYSLDTGFFWGYDENESFHLFKNKDYISAKIRYTF